MKIAFLFLAALAVGLLPLVWRYHRSPFPDDTAWGRLLAGLAAIAGGLALLIPLSDWLWG